MLLLHYLENTCIADFGINSCVEKDKTVSFEEQYWHYKRDVAWYSITAFEGV